MLIDSIKNGRVKLLTEITAKDKDGVTDILHPQTLADLAQQENLKVFIYCGHAAPNDSKLTRSKGFVNTDGNTGVCVVSRVIGCYNCNDEGHISKQCTVKKRVKDSERFKDKMLLAQSKEARVVLNDEQHDFLADSLEEIDDCKDL
ncbi:integrase, catalytic region, zinc finger, CCHC-type containing protein [Tanacetum coccineum]|uniref:Integrase, catalytic region, zinc finger, CCHC-type containing protein n=1 Tax=Tanacetum coccineum TaxID=301880 RepID=A0ABQ5H8X8_9ASTR